ncbi:MAG: monovalent cation/H+ antiporter subunit D family protein [Dehalococcoidia bacterium]|nr:monovalent cation/H+ antiporter subunit D family protein [Dehalococcoidia bacterium]MDW8119795.1 monovalent cation/H+ antiporter subunit D family protein [Chloroflexota bacterium]
MSHLPLLVPVVYLVFSLLSVLGGLWRRSLGYALALVGAGVCVPLALWGLFQALSQGRIRYALGGWPPPFGIEYVLDPLAGLLCALIATIGLVVLVYARWSVAREVPEKAPLLYPVALLLLSGLTGIVVTGDLFNLFVFLEIASLSAYALLATGRGLAPLAAFRYLMMGMIAGSFYLLGVGFLYFSTGSLNMADVAERLEPLAGSRAVAAAALLMALGLGLKMALFPLHLWLPDAYTYAPSAVTGLIAPVMTKVAGYALIRLTLDVFGPAYMTERVPLLPVVGWLAAGGILVGSVMAIAQTDFRRMLAYSSVGQVAYVALGLGLGNPMGLVGALLHTLNHAFMKGCLFLVAGGVFYREGVTEVPHYAGLGRTMPWTMAALTVGAVGMIGIPPTAGFFSKWYLVLGALDARNWVFVGVILVSSLLTAVYFFRVLEQVYTAPRPADMPAAPHSDPPLGMLVPILVLGAGVLVLGLINSLIVTHVLQRVAAPLAGG